MCEWCEMLADRVLAVGSPLTAAHSEGDPCQRVEATT